MRSERAVHKRVTPYGLNREFSLFSVSSVVDRQNFRLHVAGQRSTTIFFSV